MLEYSNHIQSLGESSVKFFEISILCHSTKKLTKRQFSWLFQVLSFSAINYFGLQSSNIKDILVVLSTSAMYRVSQELLYFFMVTLLQQKWSDFENFFTSKSAMNWILCGYCLWQCHLIYIMALAAKSDWLHFFLSEPYLTAKLSCGLNALPCHF